MGERHIAEYVRESPSMLFELPEVDQVYVSQANLELNSFAHQEYTRIRTHYINAEGENSFIDDFSTSIVLQNEDNQALLSPQSDSETTNMKTEKYFVSKNACSLQKLITTNTEEEEAPKNNDQSEHDSSRKEAETFTKSSSDSIGKAHFVRTDKECKRRDVISTAIANFRKTVDVTGSMRSVTKYDT